MHCPGSMEGPDLCPTSPQTGVATPSQTQHFVLVLLRVCF